MEGNVAHKKSMPLIIHCSVPGHKPDNVLFIGCQILRCWTWCVLYLHSQSVARFIVEINITAHVGREQAVHSAATRRQKSRHGRC